MELAITIVSIVHILLSIALICLILLQSGKAAGLSGAIGGAADSFFGKNKGRTMDAMFSRFTKICAVLFLVTSLFLAYGDTVVNKTEVDANAVETIDPASIPVAPATDATALLGTDELINSQNKFVSFKGLTVENVSYKNDEPGDDIYVDVSLDGKVYSFCVERYLTAPETDVYKAFETLKAGDIVDIEGFLYWYNGVNTHITAISLAAAAE